MEANNFEKKIQQKLDELKIPPSDEVWNSIAQEIGKKKKDRRIILILFFLGLSLLSGGYWWLYSSKQQPGFTRDITAKDPKTTLSRGIREKKPDSSAGNLTIPVRPDHLDNGKKTFSIGKVSSDSVSQLKKLPRERKEILHSMEVAATLSPQPETNGRPMESKGRNKEAMDHTFHDGENEPLITSNGIKTENPIDTAKNSSWGREVTHGVEAAKPTKQSVAINDPATHQYGKTFPPGHWVFGITLSGGKSLMVNDFLSMGDSYPVSSADMNSGPGGGSGGGNVDYASPSAIHNSVAFIGGVILQKNISARDKLSLGISYKYFSLMSKVGNRSSSVLSQYSVINEVNSYRNTFHYLEIPVSMKFQINNNKTLPLYWEAGISISRLISSNALQFQSSPGLYFKDNSLFNKMQIGLHTGILATLFSKQHTPLTVGPYFYYSPSKMAGKGLYQNKHMSFIGLQFEMSFEKK